MPVALMVRDMTSRHRFADTPMPILRRLAAAGAALLLAAATAACGGDAEPAVATPPATEQRQPRSPMEEIPFEQLYGATAAENVRVQPVEIDVVDLPAALEGTRIAVIAGFQLGLWADNEAVAAAAVRRAIEAQPHLIALLGDFVRASEDTTALARVLRPLQGRTVMAVLGTRDARNDSLEARVTRTLEAAGVRVLKNQTATLERNGAVLQVAGLDPGILGRPWADQEWILATTGGDTRPRLLLTHNPAMITRAPQGRFSAAIAANTFCGQVEVPGANRISWVESDLLPGARVEEADRMYRARNTLMFITCGIGYSFVPVRVGAPPEVALVTLRGPDAVAPVEATDTVAVDTLLERFRAPVADTVPGPG
jgi:uncharacterized protein